MSAYTEYNRSVRVVYLVIAAACWLFDVLARPLRAPRRTVVLCYHGVTRRQRERFAWQMAQLAGRAVDLAGESGAGPDARRPPVCVTFDDAFANLLDNALPALRAYRVPAIIFAVAGNLGARPRWQMPPGHPEAAEMVMSPEQLVGVAREGLCRVGSHTFTHAALDRLGRAAVEEECRRSREALEQLLGVPVEDLALPYGAHNAETLAIARRAGYRRVYTLEPRLHPLGVAGAVGRFSMDPDAWRAEFLLTCAGAYRWMYPWRRFLGWLRRVLRRSESVRATGGRPPELRDAAPAEQKESIVRDL